MNKDQYPLIEARRLGHNTLLWGVPALAIAAQAFLFSLVFSEGTAPVIGLFLALIATVIGIASLQLFMRLRWLERDDQLKLLEFEVSKDGVEWGLAPLHARPVSSPENPMRGLDRHSAYDTWRLVLWLVLAAALTGALYSGARISGFSLSGAPAPVEVRLVDN